MMPSNHQATTSQPNRKIEMPAANSLPFLQRIDLKNVLSFGPETDGLDLHPLNLLIGPNGSGKSNFIEAISLMRAAPSEFSKVTRKGGGVAEWIWKGNADGAACIDWVISYPQGPRALRHRIAFGSAGQGFALIDERLENAVAQHRQPVVRFYYRPQPGKHVVSVRVQLELRERILSQDDLETDRSILAQRRDPDIYPELAWVARNYDRIRLYREWTFGRHAVFREPQKADLRNDMLEEDFSNLGLFLNRIKTRHPQASRAILDGLADLYDGISDFNVLIEGGTVQVFFTEGDFVIPATRLSDGTLRYLCLLTILCDPDPPPLICIEEPELGLHPDVLPKLADHLLEASNRTQLIVTTHSDVLVDAMSDHPEAVVVCEKHHGSTEMSRLSADDLKMWLEKYRLGELWIRGELGGTRW
jgi:predicted ATPase